MSILTLRGGIPHIFRANIAHPTGRYHKFPATSNYLKLRTGLTQVKMYFSEKDFNDDENYIGPSNAWEGPVEANGIWLKGDAGAAEVELVVFLRRG